MNIVTIGQVKMDDRVIPLSSDPRESGKEFTVTDLHHDGVGIAAVKLFDGWREHTSRTMTYQLVSRYWGD